MNWEKDVLLLLAELKQITSYDRLDYEIKYKAMNRWINIVVKSPETQNFSQWFHLYHPLKMIYRIPHMNFFL